MREPITAIDAKARTVTTDKGSHGYDWLVLALGCRTVVDAIDGLPERWGTRAHGFYTPDSALKLAGALERFEGGDLLVDIAEMPIKCPVAPLEFVCLVDEYLTQRGIRSRTKLTLMTPLDGAFTKPICNEMLTGMLVAKGVEVVPDAPLAAVTDKGRRLPGGKTVPYDLLVTIPPHEGSDLIDEAGLGDGLGFGLTDKHTLKAKKAERVFLLGDNTNVPTSKAGSVAHFQADVVVHNLLREIAGEAVGAAGRRSRQLLHRDRLRQGDPGRLQLRHPAGARQVPAAGDRPDDAGRRIAAEPPRQARLQADLLAHAAARPRHPAGGFADEHARQAHAPAGRAGSVHLGANGSPGSRPRSTRARVCCVAGAARSERAPVGRRISGPACARS